MPAEIEVHGEDLAGAVDAAAEQLGVPADEVEYEIVDEGNRGLLGLGAREVAIVARVAGDSDEKGAPPSAVGSESDSVEAEPESGDGPDEGPDIDPGELVEMVLDAMDEILDGFDLDADSEAYVDPEGSIVVEVTGPDLGCLIGRRGLTLEAVQYLLSRVASKRAGKRVRVLADAEGYRARRREALTDLALRTARRVAQSRSSISLQPMPPSERRVVHMALADEKGVETWSDGEEPNRRVVVGPK